MWTVFTWSVHIYVSTGVSMPVSMLPLLAVGLGILWVLPAGLSFGHDSQPGEFDGVVVQEGVVERCSSGVENLMVECREFLLWCRGGVSPCAPDYQGGFTEIIICSFTSSLSQTTLLLLICSYNNAWASPLRETALEPISWTAQWQVGHHFPVV